MAGRPPFSAWNVFYNAVLISRFMEGRGAARSLTPEYSVVLLRGTTPNTVRQVVTDMRLVQKADRKWRKLWGLVFCCFLYNFYLNLKSVSSVSVRRRRYGCKFYFLLSSMNLSPK